MTDLFGHSTTPLTRPHDLTRVALVEVANLSTDKAWFLKAPDRGAKGAHVPKSKCRRGEGRDEGTWTMPRWLAHQHGWLT